MQEEKVYNVRIIVHRLNFIVEPLTLRAEQAITTIFQHLTTYKYEYNKRSKQMERSIDKTYYIYDKTANVYRFPITILKTVVTTILSLNIPKESIDYQIKNYDTDYRRVTYEWNKDFVLRDYQEEYVAGVMDNLNKPMFLIDLQTGLGKTAIACNLFYKLQYRVGIFILPKYLKKWIEDLKLYLKVTKRDIVVVQGGETLLALMEKTHKFKIVIFSIPTMQSYISSVEENEGVYPIPPEQLMSYLGIGIMFNDETHQHFHAVSKIMLYSNTKYFIGSTATFVSNEPSIARLYKVMIPLDYRISNIIGYQTYITTIPVSYRIVKRDKKHCLTYRRAHGYSHNLFEQSMMSVIILKNNYYEMITYYLEQRFFRVREDKKKDKVVIYFASIIMCEDFTAYLKGKYPNENIIKYVGGDDYYQMLKNNIIISNISMLGTAVDIPGLITVIQTVSIGSLQANIQNFGRLRRIKGRDLYYVYLYCSNIAEQIKLHTKRIKELEERSKYVKFEYYPKILHN